MSFNKQIISVEDLEYSYGNTKVLKGLNFTVEQGKIFGLFGKNGAGKTTTINILMGFLTPEKGNCLIYGDKAAKLSDHNKRRIGLLHEGHISYDFMTIDETEHFYKGFYPKWNSDIYKYFLEKLGLPRNRKIKHMSCGQRSQVTLAVLMAQGAETLILDDFSMGLDAGYRRLFLDHLNQFVKENNKTILITSHIVQDLEKFVDEAFIINKGQVLVSAPLKNIKDGIYGYSLPLNSDISLFEKDSKILDISITKENYNIISKISPSEVGSFFENINKEQIKEYDVTFEDAFIALTGKY